MMRDRSIKKNTSVKDLAMFEMLSPDAKNFRSWGKIIEYPHKNAKGNKRNLWRIIHSVSEAQGWRVAWLVLRDKTIGRLECHPNSDETFEPVRGRALLLVASKPELGAIRGFILDQPLIVFKGVWHALIALDDEVEIKITENAQVECVYWPLGFRINDLESLARRHSELRS